VHRSRTLQTYQRSRLRDSRHRADHGNKSPLPRDIAEVQEDELPFDTVLGKTTMGDGLEARASLGRFTVCCRDIIQKSCELGMDARDVYDERDDECDEETIDAARDVAAIALTSVHGLYIMDLQSSQEGSMLPPAVPLSLLDMPPRSLQDSLVAMRSRLSLTLPSDFPHNVCSEHTGLKMQCQQL
jgi:hypothetical protein